MLRPPEQGPVWGTGPRVLTAGVSCHSPGTPLLATASLSISAQELVMALELGSGAGRGYRRCPQTVGGRTCRWPQQENQEKPHVLSETIYGRTVEYLPLWPSLLPCVSNLYFLHQTNKEVE